jgi:heme-degrading monooxygenase HmoA
MSNELIEVVEFKLAKGTDEKAFLEASDTMMPDLRKQSGFIRRELLRDADGQWLDIIHWKSRAEFEQAGRNVMSIPSCLRFFEILDQVRSYQ